MTDSQRVKATSQVPSGIPGLDDSMNGGFLQGRTTVIAGGAGSGKTVLSLQSLANAARDLGEPGIFVAFEEGEQQLLENAAAFGWDLPALQDNSLFLLDAHVGYDEVKSGAFDLSGLLAVLEGKVESMGAKRIVFDAIDVILAFFDNPRIARREVYRLRAWLLTHDLTAILTCKSPTEGMDSESSWLEFLQFMADCVITLDQVMVEGVSQRSLRIVKCRGASFDENRLPFVIGLEGIETVPARSDKEVVVPVSSERITSGIARLDTMLGGGFIRGASILITGAPGTAKTTLCGAFVEAACARGERALFISFDSHAGEVERDLVSVGIHLDRFQLDGVLRLSSARSIRGSAESHLIRIMRSACEHQARCVVIDPITAMAKPGNFGWWQSGVARLIDWAKREGITLVCTSLLSNYDPSPENTPLQISTVADTWLHLTYPLVAGERNRGLNIVKSRGTEHSNQMRELVLSDDGVMITDVYRSEGAVLVGSMRVEKQRAERLAGDAGRMADQHRISLLEADTGDIEARIEQLSRELERTRVAHAKLTHASAVAVKEQAAAASEKRHERGADEDSEEGRGV